MTTILLSTILLACGPKTPSESNATPTIPNEVQTTEESEVQPTEEVLPTPKGPILGALDKADIDATIKTAMPNIQTCYENALATNPDLSGTVLLKFVIGKDGTVSSSEPKEEQTTLKSAEVIECISAEMKNIQFPAPKGGGVVIVSFPFVFQPE